jgi:hypothetical protein
MAQMGEALLSGTQKFTGIFGRYALLIDMFGRIFLSGLLQLYTASAR